MDAFDRIKQWPEGPGTSENVTSGATMAVDINDTLTLLVFSQMTANGTLNLTVNERVGLGAKILAEVPADASGRTLTFGTGMATSAISIGASKTAYLMFEHDGTNFKLVSVQGNGADELSVDYAATMAATIKNQYTWLTVAQMTAAGTLNLTVASHVKTGALLRVKVSADGTNRVLTLGTKLSGNNFTVTANKSFVLSYEFDGTNFVSTATLQQN